MNRVKNLCRNVCIFFLLFCFLFSPVLLLAQSIIPKNLVVDNINGIVGVHFDMEFQNKEEIEQALLAGESLHLKLTASLYKKRLFLWDKNIGRKKKNWQFSSNPVTQQLMIIQDGAPSMLARKDFWKNLEDRIANLEIVFSPREEIQLDQKKYFLVLEIELCRELPNWAQIVDIFWQDGLEQKIRYEMFLYN